MELEECALFDTYPDEECTCCIKCDSEKVNMINSDMYFWLYCGKCDTVGPIKDNAHDAIQAWNMKNRSNYEY